MFLKKPPVPLHTQSNAEAVREAFAHTAPLRQQGVSGFVLLRLDVAKDGSVLSARAIPPRGPAGTHVRAFDVTTGEPLPSPPAHAPHPELLHAAETAAMKLRFRPATLLGVPVRYRRLRTGFSFTMHYDLRRRRG